MQTINLHIFLIFSISILCISGQSSESIRLATSGCNKDEGDCSSTCEDIAPPGVTFTCEQISSNNFCDAPNVKSGNFCQKSCGTCSLTSKASSMTCSKYDSKVSINYNHYDACVTAARNYDLRAKSASAAIACDIARDVQDLLVACHDLATFEAEFIALSTSKFSQFSDPNNWGILAVAIAFEPYTFEGRSVYSPYQWNGDIAESDDFQELSYNYYTDCLSIFGDGCTWYHQGKLRTFYNEEGGIFSAKIQYSTDTIKEGFFTPIIVGGRFYGLAIADVVYKS